MAMMCNHIFRHPQTPDERRRLISALDYARRTGDGQGLAIVTETLMEPCEAREQNSAAFAAFLRKRMSDAELSRLADRLFKWFDGLTEAKDDGPDKDALDATADEVNWVIRELPAFEYVPVDERVSGDD